MPDPLHIAAFKKFRLKNSNAIESSIALGLFMEGEEEWARSKNPSPTERERSIYHDNRSGDHEVDRYISDARNVLVRYSKTLVDNAEEIFLNDALAEYRAEAARGHRAWRWFGVLEAITGAFFWTLILIFLVWFVQWVRPDVFEYFRNAGSH
jgi:hypothetical protein